MELAPGYDGRFEVFVDGARVYSKLETKRYPELSELLGVARGLQLGVHALAVNEDLEPAVVAGGQLHRLQPGRQPPQQLLRRPRGAWEVASSGAVLDADRRLPRHQSRLPFACHGGRSSSASARLPGGPPAYCWPVDRCRAARALALTAGPTARVLLAQRIAR